jgi:predicted regulator of Ras-like GTPase activity (Roadblock/LC7/MglB family)
MASDWVCSELGEAARLLEQLVGQRREAPAPRPSRPAPLPPEPPPPGPAPAPAPVASSPGAYRGDRLEAALARLCARAGLTGAVVADATGLPLAAHGGPVDPGRVAALASALGDALAQAERFLGLGPVDRIAVAVGFSDKAVLRQFAIEGRTYGLVVICPDVQDERGEVELSIEEIRAILAA